MYLNAGELCAKSLSTHHAGYTCECCVVEQAYPGVRLCDFTLVQPCLRAQLPYMIVRYATKS